MNLLPSSNSTTHVVGDEMDKPINHSSSPSSSHEEDHNNNIPLQHHHTEEEEHCRRPSSTTTTAPFDTTENDLLLHSLLPPSLSQQTITTMNNGNQQQENILTCTSPAEQPTLTNKCVDNVQQPHVEKALVISSVCDDEEETQQQANLEEQRAFSPSESILPLTLENGRHSISIHQSNRRGIAFELGQESVPRNNEQQDHKDSMMDKADKRKSISIVSSLDIQPIGLHKKKKRNSPSKPSSSTNPKGGLFMFFNNPRNSITRRFRASVSGKEIDDDVKKIQEEINDHENSRRRTIGNGEEEVDEETKSFYKIIRSNEARRDGTKRLEPPMDGSFMMLDSSPRIQYNDANRNGPIQNVAMSLWTRVGSSIACKLMEYCSLFEVSALSRLNQEWLSFVKAYFNNYCDAENLRTCMLLLFFKLQGIFSSLRSDVCMEDRRLKSVYSALLSHKHLLEQSLNNTSKNRLTISTSHELGLGDLFLNTYLNNLFNIIPRTAYHTSRKNEKKLITFNEIQFSLTVEIFLRDETVVNTLDTYDIERYVQNYPGSFATQLITSSMAYFSVYYLKLENYTSVTESVESSEFTDTTPETRRGTISGNSNINTKGSSFSSLKNLKFESNVEDTIEMFRSPRTPSTPALSNNSFNINNSFKMDKGEFLIAKGSGSTKKRRESLASETESVISSISLPSINFNYLEVAPKESSELGYMFLLEFFKILSKYIRRLTFSRKPHTSERFRMDYFSTMSLSPNCETFSAFMSNEDGEFKKNSKKFKNVCNAIATSEALTCLVMGGKEWTQDDVTILFNSFSIASDEIKRDNYQMDLILPCLLEISERCTKPKLRLSVFLPPPSKNESLVSDINITEINDVVASPRIQTDTIHPSFFVTSTGDSQVSDNLDDDVIRWPKHMKRVYLTDINENLIFHERWLNGGPGMLSLHFNFSLSSPINFEPIALCLNLRYLHISDCSLGNNKNTALNLVNAIKQLDKLEGLSLERVNMENGAWVQLFEDVLTTSPTLNSFRVVDSINQTPIVSSFVHAAKIRVSQLDKIELKLKGFGEKDKLMINSLIEQVMLHGNAKTVIADCKFHIPNQSGEKYKSKKSCTLM